MKIIDERGFVGLHMHPILYSKCYNKSTFAATEADDSENSFNRFRRRVDTKWCRRSHAAKLPAKRDNVSIISVSVSTCY